MQLPRNSSLSTRASRAVLFDAVTFNGSYLNADSFNGFFIAPDTLAASVFANSFSISGLLNGNTSWDQP
ncbi:hypothetical protein LguiB_000530 [Lonicera macranthoides]